MGFITVGDISADLTAVAFVSSAMFCFLSTCLGNRVLCVFVIIHRRGVGQYALLHKKNTRLCNMDYGIRTGNNMDFGERWNEAINWA